jgi:hypothetical protein
MDGSRRPIRPLEQRRFLALRPRRLAITEAAHVRARAHRSSVGSRRISGWFVGLPGI